MTTLARTAVLPFDHLAAELIAFPLRAETTLTDPVTHLDPTLRGSTGRLWRAAERELLAAAPGISLDELTAMRDDYWFGGPDGLPLRGPRPLHRHLRAATRRYLTPMGAGFGAGRPAALLGPQRPAPAAAEARRAWMWLTFALPSDLLLSGCGEHGWIPEPDLLSPPLRDLLRRGFAETHLHVGASFDFPTVWATLTARLAQPGVHADAFRAPGADLGEGADLVHWLVRSVIARWALARFVAAGAPGTFEAFFGGPLRAEACAPGGAGPGNLAVAEAALRDLANGRLSDLHLGQLAAAYRDLAGIVAPDEPHGLADLRARDPLSTVLPGTTGSPEQRYVHRTTTYLDRCEERRRADEAAAVLFWQTVRVRVLLYRYLTQRPLTPGLPWFIRFYARMSAARGTSPPHTTIAAADRTSGGNVGLHSLEMRTAPVAAIAELTTWAVAVDRAGAGVAERGLVFHFLKQRGGDIARGILPVGGAGTHADPAAPQNAGRCRYSGYFTEQTRSATALARMLLRWPHTQFSVRALDACNDELAVPAWVLRPLLALVRNAAYEGARAATQVGLPPPPPLRTTIHAGEDYAHLLTGLRQIHEAIEVLGLQEGDRIGHGLALGMDPALWAARTGRAALPSSDRVLDLAWEWSWWTRRGGGADAARLAYIEREVSDVGSAWFGTVVDIADIQRLRSDLADPDTLAAAGFPDRPPRRPPHDHRARLLQSYLRSHSAFRAGRVTVLVDPTNEVDALNRLSVSLREEIARGGLAIEINPTSNLLIGDLADVRNHPLWRLAPPRPRDDLPPLAVTIGSDDPLVFNCTLPGEYQLLFDSLVLAGLTDAEAMRWLDGVRRTGLERSFTVGPSGWNGAIVVCDRELPPLS